MHTATCVPILWCGSCDFCISFCAECGYSLNIFFFLFFVWWGQNKESCVPLRLSKATGKFSVAWHFGFFTFFCNQHPWLLTLKWRKSALPSWAILAESVMMEAECRLRRSQKEPFVGLRLSIGQCPGSPCTHRELGYSMELGDSSEPLRCSFQSPGLLQMQQLLLWEICFLTAESNSVPFPPLSLKRAWMMKKVLFSMKEVLVLKNFRLFHMWVPCSAKCLQNLI